MLQWKYTSNNLLFILKLINSHSLYYLYMTESENFYEWEKSLGPENKGFTSKNIKDSKYRKSTLDPYLRARKRFNY